jgi:glycine/D-amino acid oxidase-like deaminating enzyme/nitrite reductase/ring-hydroxylating ferredoxin subunit
MYPRTASLWAPLGDVDSFPILTRHLETDVVVVGAGITGLTAALRLAEAGKRVAVLEGRTLCSGVTAGTTAHVTEQVDPRYVEIARRFGKEGSRLVARAAREALDHIAGRVERLGIACDWRRVPGYLYAEEAAQRDTLVEEHRAAREAGLDVTLDADPGLPFAVAGALLFPDQQRFHPRAYVWGLARAAMSRGVRIFEHTRVVEIKDGEPVEITTEQGARVRAGAVLCATHVPLNRLFLQTKLGHYQSYAAAFRACPVPDALFWDTADPYHYLRSASIDGVQYLIVGGEDHKTGGEEHTQIPFERLLAYARARFGTDRPDFHWSAQVIEPIDGLPYIGHNSSSKHVYVATGFSGNGMTYGTIGALLMSDLVLGVESPYAALFDATRVKPSSVGNFLRETKEMPVHFIGDRLDPPDVTSTRHIERDQGRSMKVDGKRLAVYRDRQGALHAVSAVCTHMGCLVKFNEAERSWDCPCHGSRFGVDGQVLDGPAITPLEPIRLQEDEEPATHAPVPQRRRG